MSETAENISNNALGTDSPIMVEDIGLSVWDLFLSADIVVKIVMLLLIITSIWCWAVIFEKWRQLRRYKQRADRFDEIFWQHNDITDFYNKVGKSPKDPLSAVFGAGMGELLRHSKLTQHALLQAERKMHTTITREADKLEQRLGLLATTGSAAPFVGLFGTVWGIMNSFTSIAATKQTSLAVVAPGIAEALFATALGLVAAIPATIAYNKIANDLGRYINRIEGFTDDFLNFIEQKEISPPQNTDTENDGKNQQLL